MVGNAELPAPLPTGAELNNGEMRQPHPVALFSLAVLLFEHCASVTLTRITQQRSNAPRPIASVLVLLTEALKLLMSVCLELTDCGGLGSASTLARLRDALCRSPPDTLRLSVPAVLYTFQNLAIYFALGHLEVIIFQVLYQTKLLLTAVLSVLLLGRRLTFRLPRLLRPPIDPRQWRRCGWPRVAQLLGRSACRPLLGLLQLQRQSSIARLGLSARLDGACWLVGRTQWRSAPSRIEVSGHLVDRPRAHGIRERHVFRKELRLDVQERCPARHARRNLSF